MMHSCFRIFSAAAATLLGCAHSTFRLWKQDGIDTFATHDSKLLKMHVTTEQGDRAKFSYRRHVVLRVQ